MVVDTHCHLYVPPLGDDVPGVAAAARARGVNRVVVPGVDPATSAIACALASQMPDFASAAVGWHPQFVRDDEVDEDALMALARRPGVVAIGEIGLDGEVEAPAADVQERRLRAQLRVARKAGLPVLLHCRRAFTRLTEILREEFADGPGGILHAWAGSAESLRDLLPFGLCLGVAGTATRPHNTRVRALVAALPPDRIVVETDAPYIASLRHAKGASEPADAADVCATIAELHGISFDEAARITTENARRVLRIP